MYVHVLNFTQKQLDVYFFQPIEFSSYVYEAVQDRKLLIKFCEVCEALVENRLFLQKARDTSPKNLLLCTQKWYELSICIAIPPSPLFAGVGNLS